MTILNELRDRMEERGIDVYLVPTDDDHGSEYVGDHFKCREKLTGFTGSAGFAFVAFDEAGLYTDGRYFLQAEKELKGSGFTLYRSGEKGVPTLAEKLEAILPNGGVLGYDGRVISAKLGEELEKVVRKKAGRIESSRDLVGEIWTDRPERSAEKVWVLPERFSGESVESKLARVRKAMTDVRADMHVLSSLTDIAWLFNIRGNDVKHCPVALAYAVLTLDGAMLYIQEEAMTVEVAEALSKAGVDFAPYDSIYAMAREIRGRRILLSKAAVNDRLYRLFSAENEIVNRENPTSLMKAVKNETEVENIRRAEIKDSVAICRFLAWLDKAVGRETVTEITVEEKLREFRKEMRGYLDDSFDTIAGYKDHGAIIHYEATPETDRELLPEGLLLIDTGAHFIEGTTDVTRTVALGPVTDEEKEMFTLVLRSHLSLLDFKFLKGCSGRNFDLFAREPLWEKGLDYRHGTGHGVGYLLSVHEGPNSFGYKEIPGRNAATPFEVGMVTTDEPGIYVEGKFGVRIESELLCRKWLETEYGEYLTFEAITYVPIDLNAVIPERLSPAETEKLNRYHDRVRQEISPYLDEEELAWLMNATRRI